MSRLLEAIVQQLINRPSKFSCHDMDALAGTDILLALTGGSPTIESEDLCKVIEMVKPKVVIPMYNRIPGSRFFMLPVTDFTKCYPDLMVEWSDSAEVEYTENSLPNETRILVLKPTLVKDKLRVLRYTQWLTLVNENPGKG